MAFGVNIAPTWPPKAFLNRPKLVPKSIKKGSRCWPYFCLNFDRSRDAFLSILFRSWKAEGAKNIEKPQLVKHFCYFGKLANKRPYDWFFGQVGLQLETQNLPKLDPRGFQNRWKRAFKIWCKLAWNLEPSWDGFGWIWGQLGSQVGAKLAPKSEKFGHRKFIKKS